MDNIIECRLNSTCKEIFAGLWQHDYGQILRITGADLPKAVEVQFSLKDKGGDTLTRIGTTVDGATEVKVPDSLLKNENCTQNYLIYAWIYVTDDTSGNTEYKIILHVKSRSKPEKPTEEPLPEPNIFHETVEAVNVSAERAAARERMGIDEWEDVITYITSSEEEECTTCYIDFEHTYRKIYVLIDESAIKGTTYMSVRFGVIGKNKLHNVALLANTSPAFNIKQKYKTFSAEVMNTADTSYRYTASSSLQLYSYCENPFIGRVGTPSITAVDASAIGGITWYGKMYAGTRIVVKGVRA